MEMEYHESPPSTKALRQLHSFQEHMKECFMCAATLSGLVVTNFQAWKISETETHYTLKFDKSELISEIIKNSDELKLNNHIQEYASIYKQYSDVPPQITVLIETIELNSQQLSATWEFKHKDETEWEYDAH